MIDGAAQRIVLSDASRRDAVAPHATATLTELDLVIGDAGPRRLRDQMRIES